MIKILQIITKVGWKMSNELEKQFFKCFGIEPRYEDACTVEDKYWNNEELANEYETFDQYMNCKCSDQENCTTECSCAYQREVYPQITDHILLELICIINQMDLYFYDELYYFTASNYKDLKEEVISKCKRLADKNALSEVTGEHIKHQVRTIFEDV